MNIRTKFDLSFITLRLLNIINFELIFLRIFQNKTVCKLLSIFSLSTMTWFKKLINQIVFGSFSIRNIIVFKQQIKSKEQNVLVLQTKTLLMLTLNKIQKKLAIQFDKTFKALYNNVSFNYAITKI